MNLQPRQTLDLHTPTTVRYQVLGWVCVLSMITYIDRVCIKQVGGEMRAVLGVTEQQFAWVFSAFGLAYALFEVPSGWLGDRFGPRRVLTRIVLCWSLFTALTGCVVPFTWDSGYQIGPIPILFSGFLLLVVIRFLFGAGEAGAYPNIARALRNWFPYRRRGLAQGMLWMFGRWGGALAPILIGMFASWFGWRGAFWAFGILGALWVVSFAIWFRDTPAEHPHVNDAERALILGQLSLVRDVPDATPPSENIQPAPASSITANPDLPAEDDRIRQGPPPISETNSRAGYQPGLSWRTMLKSRTLWCLCLMYFCSNAGWCFFITWDVKYYETVLRLSGTPLQIASGAPLFFGGIACLLGGFLTDALVRVLGRRWGRTFQGMVSYFLGGFFFLLALLTTNPWLAVPCLCVASFLKDFAMASSWSVCIDIGHRYSGTVSGFMNMVGNLGTFVSPPIVAHLASAGRWELALVYSACMFFTASAGWVFINPKRVIVYTPDDRRRLQDEGAIQ
jgi:MFS family permease